MKIDFYDLFSLHTPKDFPEAGEDNYITAAVKSRVMENIPTSKNKLVRIGRIGRAVIAAAAVAACMGITVGAVSGRLGQFFSTLSRSEISDSTFDNELPAVGDNQADMTEYYALPEAEFTTDGSVSAELLGIYNDSSTLMLSLMITPENGDDISNMLMPVYFTLKCSDGSEKILGQSGLAGIERFTRADANGSYCLTFYLTDPNIAGSTLEILSDGLYTADQIEMAHKIKLERQRQEREQFESDEEWLAHKAVASYSHSPYEAERLDLQKYAPDAFGAVSAEIEIPETSGRPTEANAYGISMRLDSLSLYVSKIPDELKGDMYAGAAYTVYLKDGSVISDEFFMFDDVVLTDNGYDFNGTRYSQYAYMRGTETGSIRCFDRPIAAYEVGKIAVYIKSYDEEYNEQVTEYILYGE